MKNILKQLPVVMIAIAIMAASINMFLAPHNIAAGGVSGIGVLLEWAVGIDRAVVVMVLNIGMLVLAFFFLGRPVFIKSLIGSLLLPVGLALMPEMMLVQDRMLSVIFGSILFAIAVAILYRRESSSGGTTIPPLIMKKYAGVNTAVGLLVTDMVDVVFNIFVIGMESFLFAVLSLIITSVVMTYIETGMNRKKAVVITSRSATEDIRRDISGEGGHNIKTLGTEEGDRALVVLLDDKDYPSLLKLVDERDKSALVVAYNVAEAHGIGGERSPLDNEERKGNI